MSTWFAAFVAWAVLTVILSSLFYQKWNQIDSAPEQGQKRISDMKSLLIFWLLTSIVIGATCKGVSYAE